MNETKILSQDLFLDENMIYNLGALSLNQKQKEEIQLRENVAAKQYDDYLSEIAKHHSIPVMDKEVELFLSKIPTNGTIVDVGGCWGWHWRNIDKIRPDVKIYIVDFVKRNLFHAKVLLDQRLIGSQIFLIHADATNLPFLDGVFDGYWTVQTLQHIPNFESAIVESKRILKSSGIFANYSLNNQWLIRFVYNVFGKNYHVKGNVDNTYYLERFSNEQREIIERVFGKKGSVRYSEILFKPTLKFNYPGNINFAGKLDSLISNGLIGKSVARQMSFHTSK